MWPKTTTTYSPNFSLPKRSKNQIKFIILHYTGMRKESSAIKKLCNLNSKVSAHYFIKNNGQILNLVPDLYKAWHAGNSQWKTFKSINKYSIGIEINNPGHNYGYKKFKKKQILSLKRLLKYLIKEYSIELDRILGHSDIAPYRKKDPGEKFPWKEFAKKKLCLWHSLNENKLKKFRNQKLTLKEEKRFINNLYKIGYLNIKRNNSSLVKNFQRKFRQNLINGKIDKECLLISKNLLNS
tara:strand:+ start:504 stop:1220 length:717 start_codon:yes stop_codon:yes gene_type:complete